MSKIIGVTVGTPLSPHTIKEKLKPVLLVNGEKPDEDGNVEVKSGTDIINKILDPERYPLTEEKDEDAGESREITVALEFGMLSRTNGTAYEDEIGLRTPDFIPIQGASFIYPYYEMIEPEVRMCFLFYDGNYEFMTEWNEGVGYYYAGSGVDVPCPDGAVYMKASYYVHATEGMVTFVTASALHEETVTRAEHKKIFIADHGYAIYGDVIDTDTMHKIVIEAEGKDGNTYNIVELKAPIDNPEESTMCLMNWGGGKKQFVDFSSMVYDPEDPTVEIVCQTRGGLKLPEFSVRYNDGNGAGRVKKFVVKPDAIPLELTSEGIRVRRNNNFDNSFDGSEFVTVNLADLYDRALPTVSEADNGKVVEVVNGVLTLVPVAESSVKTFVDEYISSALEGDY